MSCHFILCFYIIINNTDDGKLGKSTEKVMHERPTIAEVNIDKKAKRWLCKRS